MKVKWVSTKVMGKNFGVLETIATMKPKEWAFFKELVEHAEDDLFLSGEKQTVIMSSMNIGRTTYWKRIEAAVKLGILYKSSRSVYRFNDKWIKLVTLDVQVVGADRHTTQKNQKLVNLKI